MKEKILEKAGDMFLTLGFKSVTMDDLAQQMGISKKTIYTHFENKTKLVAACTHHLFEVISGGIDGICALNKNPIEELYEIKKYVMQFLKDEKSSPQYQLQKYYPKIYSEMRENQYCKMKTCVVDNIQRGLDQGFYRENLNVEFISRIYYAGGVIIKDHALFPPDKFSHAQLMDDFLEYHLRGIVTPKGRKILNTIINSNQE
ncbi:TetR/AcrR family transcriptional regulator [Euzebyella marina]|uniref:TetR/AcrR family transcriptional regulator n=1 Tax=Euzebyella marina TaxID=1761453 RepID=A0A3G2L206_9FLAO|nr:TetR/AcrR family transcriptional regulator [Euzebyella marina]AYN66273.1 TetR/AcrR family transcriptional regulator [Euzebyella marina]MBG50177.1 TetR family transcriptional regulator [Pseudozobellia sp.]|tara:strand:+ start:5026 stop:5631 length:606 start_codon:yes stop_codon:yes gene_type:complete